MTAVPEATALWMLSILFRNATPVEGADHSFSFDALTAMQRLMDDANSMIGADGDRSGAAKYTFNVVNELLRLLTVEYAQSSDNPQVIADSLEIRATALEILAEAEGQA